MKILAVKPDFQLTTEVLRDITPEPFGILCASSDSSINVVRPFRVYEIWAWCPERETYIGIWCSDNCQAFIQAIVEHEIKTIIGCGEPRENIVEFHRRIRKSGYFGALLKLNSKLRHRQRRCLFLPRYDFYGGRRPVWVRQSDF